ncbi:hypothetical protein CP556_14925 [Natrinema sp. CBA1119]|uniref:hypothetical protein n=1 Tax=Natrinema sp. CBA1119 TaxID=1608465 RepID=UPI000BF5F1B3|nr:hypothetical protein [Natrinema sp. CBA1119]PGF17262.1 hypothetical protein CP556_14925 [Natrinema sp. CBA1119]
MKRRNVVVGLALFAAGSGAALGTGAVDVARSRGSDSSFPVVAPQASLTIQLFGEDEYGDNVSIEDGGMFGGSSPNVSDLPQIYVSGSDGEMVTVQVVVGLGRNYTFEKLFKITNNSDRETRFDVGFGYSFPDLLREDSGTNLSARDACEVFQLVSDGTLLSPDPEGDTQGEPADTVGIMQGESFTIGLETNTTRNDVPGLHEELSDNVFGNVGGSNRSRSVQLIEEVTAEVEQTR